MGCGGSRSFKIKIYMLGVPGGAVIYHCIARRLSPPDKNRVVVERYRFFGIDDPRNHRSRVMCEIMFQNIMIAVLVFP